MPKPSQQPAQPTPRPTPPPSGSASGSGAPSAPRVRRDAPKGPDPERMAADALITSIVAGVSFVAATVVFGFLGGLGLQAANAIGVSRPWKLVLLGIGLAGALAVLAYLLRANRERLEAKGRNWYRGAWLGVILSLSVIVIMYYVPWIALPQYCPPGAPCEVTGVR